MAVCDISKYPRAKYFQQHEMPEYGPENYSYEYTRLLSIRAEATIDEDGPVPQVKTLSTTMLQLEDGKRPGIHKDTSSWEEIVDMYVRPYDAAYDQAAFAYGVPRTPFDFALWDRSRIIIQLSGEFWRFSASLAAVTTKHQYGSQYFDLQRHFADEDGQVQSVSEAEWEHRWGQYDCRCVSFYCQEPCLEKFQMVHGFSLNIDFLMDIEQPGGAVTQTTLPITIDPDVENKGANPGP